MTDTATMSSLQARIAADPDARFAISLDRLAYAKDNHVLGTDLVRTYVRNVNLRSLPENEAGDVLRLLGGIKALTGRAKILGHRYGDLAVAARDSGSSLFDFEDDALARDVVTRIGASDPDLAARIGARAVTG